MNDQVKTENSVQLSFRDLFYSLPETSPRVDVRDKICNKLGVAVSSLYDKIRNNRFTKSEMMVIADLLEQPIETLFPEAL